MKVKNRIILLMVIMISTFIWKTNIFHSSFAYPYELEESILFYEENLDKLEKKIKIYLEDIDDFLITNSSFELSDILVQNYDFLVYFSLDYILNYQESYNDKIKTLNNYSYITKEGIKKQTNQYIPLEEIYSITDKYFGIKDFEIINDNVQIIDNYITLTNYTELNFQLKIENVSAEIKDNKILTTVNYENNNCYLYTFENQNNVLKIKNIEVLS